MNFGKRLSSLREQKGLSQLDLATRLNVTHQAISKYELNKRKPDFDTLIRIADLFKVSIDYLLDRTSNPFVNDQTMYEEEFALLNELKNYPDFYIAIVRSPKQKVKTMYDVWSLIRNSVLDRNDSN